MVYLEREDKEDTTLLINCFPYEISIPWIYPEKTKHSFIKDIYQHIIMCRTKPDLDYLNKRVLLIKLTKAQYMDITLGKRTSDKIGKDILEKIFPWDKLNIIQEDKEREILNVKEE